ncbi:MAG: hypothetical protein ACYC48_00365 [Minisyncoccota bacterium]
MAKEYLQVREARLTGDTEALRKMAQKGGRQAARNRTLKRARLRRLAIEQASIFFLSPDGDVLPPDLNLLPSLGFE